MISTRRRVPAAAISMTAFFTVVLTAWVTVSGSVASAGHPCTITGTDGDDVLIGTPDPDVLCGLGGRDTLRGLGGLDRLFGGGGADRLFGGARLDLIEGGSGKDRVFGGPGNDHMDGGQGVDSLRGGGDRDSLETLDGANGGNDRLFGGPGNDFVADGAGDDTATAGTDTTWSSIRSSRPTADTTRPSGDPVPTASTCLITMAEIWVGAARAAIGGRLTAVTRCTTLNAMDAVSVEPSAETGNDGAAEIPAMKTSHQWYPL